MRKPIGRGYSDGVEGTLMNDGSYAWLLPSKRYYARREPEYDSWDTIAYYSLDKDRILLASAVCQECGERITSKMCGDFVRCSCDASFVDTDRWMPERQRYGGNCEPVKN